MLVVRILMLVAFTLTAMPSLANPDFDGYEAEDQTLLASDTESEEAPVETMEEAPADESGDAGGDVGSGEEEESSEADETEDSAE